MKFLLLEDHPLFRLGVRQLLLQHWPEATCLEAETLAQALVLVSEQPCDIAVIDLNLPDAAGVESVSQLRRRSPEMRLLVLSMNTEAAYARRVLQLGASAFLTKSHAADELVQAVQKVAAGGRYITASLADILAEDLVQGARERAPHEDLAPQEYRVMMQLAAGARVGDVATAMHLSPKTVSTYRSRVLEKLGVQNNVELALYCQQHRLQGDVAA